MSDTTSTKRSESFTEKFKYRLDIGQDVDQDEYTIQDVAGAFFDDPNLDREHLELEDDSPYPEVRSAVANTDDPDMPCGTLRAWVIGILAAILIPGLNQFFFFRFPAVSIGNFCSQLLAYPIGVFCARVLPRAKIFGLELNPGPFTIKEHVVITMMATVAFLSAYATDIIAVQRTLYHQKFSFAYQWLVVMSTQLIGYSLGGICKRFLVSPPSMIWPSNLVFCALFNTLHSRDYAGISAKGISRQRFFLYAFFGSFFWYFIPGYLFQALSVFSWVCWIAPNNRIVNQLFGYETGLGMSIITFDWSQISFIGSPLATPWWAEANIFGGFVCFFWILCPILYYTNAFYTAYLPIIANGAFDNQGNPYNVTAILNDDLTFNLEKYRAYSPLFLSISFALSYGLSFASITSVIVHSFLYFRKQIWVQARRSLNKQPDIHARLMSQYKQVPDWWYMVIFVIMFVFGILAIELWPTKMPVWAFVLALIIAFIYTIPVGMIQAVTNQQVGLNVITELVVGYALPGRPIAMMMFKTWGYITMVQCLQFTSDFKLGHYLKIPPRTMFTCQVVATVLAATTQLGVQAWMFEHIEGICSLQQKDGFICPTTHTFGTASILWGVIGPELQFSKGTLFYPLTFFFIIGAVAPFIPFVITRKYPNSILKYVNFPAVFNGTSTAIPPATAVNFIPWALVGFIFQYVIRRRNFTWWTKYNYVLSAGLDSGVAVAGVLIFFCLQYPKHNTIGRNTIAKWWGNTVFINNADGQGLPHLDIDPAIGHFGPDTW